MRFVALSAILIALFSASCKQQGLSPEVAEQVQQLRNLGKAFYENPGSAENAVETLKKALELNPSSAREKVNYALALLRAGKADAGMALLAEAQQQDPSIPNTWFNLGIEYKKLGDADHAIEQLEHMAEIAPDNAKTQYNLGQLYKQLDRNEDAIKKFELSAKLDPSLAAPHFQLYNMFRRDDRERARTELDEFKRIKKLQDETGLDEDIDWSYYSELYDPVEPGEPAQVVDGVSFEASSAAGEIGAPRGVLALDSNADQKVDALFWGASSGSLLAAAGTPVEVSALAGAAGVAAGDPDNDGFPDLCVVSAKGASVVANAAGVFGPPQSVAAGDFDSCLWHDYDHDGDLDLFLLGARNALLRYADAPDQAAGGALRAG